MSTYNDVINQRLQCLKKDRNCRVLDFLRSRPPGEPTNEPAVGLACRMSRLQVKFALYDLASVGLAASQGRTCWADPY